ncbi:MAG TPA: glycosyltransferase family 39 protein [Verrucomicrobiae bacterium]|nr:glycosyltransferase family 39 protein [Verrucomicrobiae bacterium]
MIERAMHPSQKAGKWGLIGLFVILIPLYLVLPLSEGRFLASPDESANAEVIRQIAWYGRVSTPEPLAVEFPWLHPRSFVSHADSIVPVGFLGWPWVLSLFALILGLASTPVIASLVGVSMAYPLFKQLEEKFGYVTALVATLIGMTVPAMLVFGNRALFPQVPVLAFGLWAVWLLRKLPKEKRWWPYAAAGLLVSLAFSTRPTEMLWLAPWLAWASWSLRPTRRQLLATIISFLIPLMFIGVFAQSAYGGFWKSGYALHDNPSLAADVSAPSPAPPSASAGWRAPSLVFPFGIHPKNVWWNTEAYLVIFQWPYFFVLLFATILIGREMYRSRDENDRTRFLVPALAAWTMLVLIGYYGHGLYSDNINGGSITVANSFIRYLLPIGPVIALAWAYLMSKLPPKTLRWMLPASALLLAAFGIWSAFVRDDEGILATRTELMRYSTVLDAASAHFHPSDVILSDRSDKVFFPSFRAVSPVPELSQIADLHRAHPELQIGLYARPLTQQQQDAWRMAGFEPSELASSGREELYLLRPITR